MDLVDIAVLGGVGIIVLEAVRSGIQGVPGAPPGTPTVTGSPPDPTQAPANNPAGNAFEISNMSTFRHFDGLWYVDGDIEHMGGGGTFVGQLDLRESGIFGFGAGQYQRAGTFNFDVPQDDVWTSHHISSGQGLGGPPTFFGSDALFTIVGLGGEEYTHRQIAADQGGF